MIVDTSIKVNGLRLFIEVPDDFPYVMESHYDRAVKVIEALIENQRFMVSDADA